MTFLMFVKTKHLYLKDENQSEENIAIILSVNQHSIVHCQKHWGRKFEFLKFKLFSKLVELFFGLQKMLTLQFLLTVMKQMNG